MKNKKHAGNTVLLSISKVKINRKWSQILFTLSVLLRRAEKHADLCNYMRLTNISHGLLNKLLSVRLCQITFGIVYSNVHHSFLPRPEVELNQSLSYYQTN